MIFQFFFKIFIDSMQAVLQEFMTYIGNLPSVQAEATGAAFESIRKYYHEINDPGMLSFAFFKLGELIMRSKAVPEHTQQLFEQCIYDIIDRVIDSQFRMGTEALRLVMDTSMEYYKHHSLDPLLRHPLGINRKLNYYEPEVGEEVDVVKPYITSTSYCAWTRGTLIAREGKKYTVKYANTETPAVLSSQPFFDLLGSRTQDHSWRDSLEFGSLIDAYSKFWYPATVVEVGIENGARRVRVSFRRFSENGKKMDSDGNRYDGLGPNEDDWIDIYSCRIQRPGKMARQLCQYSHTCEEIVIDDTYDLLFEKEYESEPFAGIMRCSFTRSLAFLHFYEHFWKRRGNEIFLEAFQRRDLPIDNYINMLIVFGNSSFLVPRMGLQRHLPAHLKEAIEYLKEQHKQFNPMRLDAISYFIETTAKRLFSLSRKHIILNDIRRFLVVEYLKLNLQKQMIALRYIYELIKPARPYQNEAQLQELHNFLIDNQIFYRIVHSNAHEQILGRTADIIRYMLDNKLAGWTEVDHVWSVVPHSDLRGRATIERLIGDISKDFPFQFTAKIIDRLLSVKETELTIDKLNLLRVLKDKPLSVEYKVKILNYLWECLTVKATSIKQQVEEEVENVFRGFISTIKESSLKLEVLRAILQRLRQITTVRTEMYLFKEFILTYPLRLDPALMHEEQAAPQVISEVVDYLKKEHIYENLLRLLGCVKAKQKVESILEFIQFLFEKDRDDISGTVKAIYDLLGPSDVFLLWARALTSRATSFFVQLYQHPTNMQKFDKLSSQAMQAIKSILLDINVSVGNIRVLKKKKVVPVMQGPLLPSQNTVGTSTEDYSVKPEPKGKEEVLTFVYVLKSPFECIGVSFLLQLCQYITVNQVYNDVIKLIIQFIVSLDDSILSKAESFREEFLSMMFRHIAQIVSTNQLASSRVQLDIYINLIQELFAETEREGLIDARPHFSTIEGEVLRLKVENCISGNELHRKEPIIVEMNENNTLWELKGRLSEIYGEPVNKLDVIKYVNPIEDQNNGKALTDLHFFNEEGIKVTRRDPREIPRHELLSPDGHSLSQIFNRIVEKWFAGYEHDGLLRLEDLVKLGAENWKGSLMKDQAKLQEMISKYDTEGRGGITLANFKDFFWRKSVENNALVWRILNLSGYRNNLRHKDEPDPLPPISPRKILSARPVYDTIFQVLENQAFQPVHLNFYRLLVMLETDQELCTIVKGNIRDFLEGEKCIYRLSYGLESLINELQNNLPLYAEFYEHNGHQEIANKLEFFFTDPEKSIYSFDTSLKTIVIPNLLKILNSYVYPLAATHKMVRFFKKVRINHMDMPEIIKKLDGEENYADPQEEKRQALLGKGRVLNIEQLYQLALRILQNLTKNFTNEYLVRVSHEIIRLYASLSFAYSGFSPEHIINCANSGSLNIRRSSHALVYLYLLEHPNEAFDLLQKIVEGIPSDIKFASNTYFELMRCILEKSVELVPDNQHSTEFLTKLALQLLEHLFKAPNQQRQTFSASRIIEGILQNLLVLIQKRPNVGRFLHHFKEKLIQDCLFFYDVKAQLEGVQVTPEMLVNPNQPEHFANYVKCKSEATRKLLMEIIFLLYKESQPQEDFFHKFILPILSQLPDNSRRTAGKFMHVGLNNLGSTCYLNSMLQVLNSIDSFRNVLMRTASDAPLVRQLQSLFSYLFFSERLDYVPRQLLNAFTPPINPSIQQDTTEFLNFLFDQLQPLLKVTPYRLLLEEIFKGYQVTQMICHACGGKRERQETFFSYSVEIEGKYDLHAALDGMHAGELISDCMCQSCGMRSDTTKRSVLKQVPNIFFIHLKRIVFDYNIFMNTKIHTRLFFPEELDFEPFTKEGLELREGLGVEYMKGLKDNEEETKKFAEQTLHGRTREFYKLRLKAIIVHSGTPDVGHYYTILKRGNNWIKFDDSRISSFPMTFFQEECYGGSWVADEWGGSSSSKNAYVLIYEKDNKKDIEIEQLVEGKIQKRQLPEKQLGTFNTPEWYKQVWLDNHSLMLEQHLTAENYTKEFLNFICKMLELTPSTATIHIVSEVFFKICALSGEVGTLLEIFHKNLALVDGEILDKYVLSDPKRTFGVLFHQQSKVRDFASSYLERVLMLSYERGDTSVKEKVVRFIQEYLTSLHGEVAKNWLRIDGYFKLFQKLVETSIHFPELYAMFVSSDLIAYLIDFIMEKQSPLSVYQKKYSLGTKSNPVNFSSGLNIILFLLKRSFGLIGNNYEVPAIPISQLFHLSDNAVSCLSCMPFYEKMIKENQNAYATAAIIERLSILNIHFSHAVSRVLLKVFNENTDAADDCETDMLCISRLLNIRDDFWTNRAQFVLGYATCYIFDKNVMSTLEEEKYVYPSTLENVFPLQSLLSYIHINRNRVPLTVLNMIKTLLESTACSQQAMDYLINQPAPSYVHLRYIDWLRPYVNEVVPTLTSISDKRRQECVGKVSLCNLYLDDLEKRIQSQQSQMFVQVLGQVGEKILTSSSTDPEKQVQVNIYRVPVFGVESLPNGKGNSIFDACLNNGRLQTLVTEDSNILRFFKQSSKPLAIKAKNVEQAEDKEIISLFDEDPNPIKKETENIIVAPPKQEEKMVIEPPKNQPIALQSIQEIVPVEMNIEGGRELDDYLHLIEIINNTDSNKLVVLSFTSHHNARLPRSLRVMASKSKEDYYFHKTDPYTPLGHIDYQLLVNQYAEVPKPFFRLYGNNYAQPQPEPVSEPEPAAKETPKENMEIEPNGNVNEDFMDSDQINCPICTFFNPTTNTECEVCGSQLHQA